jgi:hypothetical protein
MTHRSELLIVGGKTENKSAGELLKGGNMAKLSWALILLGFLLIPGTLHADSPRELAGIRIGGNVKDISHLLRMEMEIPVRNEPYLREVPTIEMEGYRSGYVTYGTCAQPGRIVRIKMKHQREDKDFFEDLFREFKKKFGESCEYRGDVFRQFVAWKWSFNDSNDGRLSLILQHNSSGDEEYTSGNSVKLTSLNWVQEEEACYAKKNPRPAGSTKDAPPKGNDKVDIQQFIPR